MLPFIRYSLLRLVLLMATGALCYLLGLRGVYLLLVAFLVSGVLSLFMLDRQRDVLGQKVGGIFSGINKRIDASARAEDLD